MRKRKKKASVLITKGGDRKGGEGKYRSINRLTNSCGQERGGVLKNCQNLQTSSQRVKGDKNRQVSKAQWELEGGKLKKK